MKGLVKVINKIEEIARTSNRKLRVSKLGKLPVEGSLEYPKLSFGGDLKLVELEKSRSVGLDGSIYLKFDPLFGVNVKLDIVDWLIMAFTGPYIALIKEARADIKEGIKSKKLKASAEIVLDLEFKGNVTSNLSWDYKQGVGSANGSIDSLFGLSITAKIEGVAEAYFVSIKAGLEVKATGENEDVMGLKVSGYGGTAENKPTLALRVIFTGVKLVYSKYVKFLIIDQDVTKTAEALSPKEVGFGDSSPAVVSGVSGYLAPMIAKAKEDAQNFHYLNETMETDIGKELLILEEHVMFDSGKSDDDSTSDKPKSGDLALADL